MFPAMLYELGVNVFASTLVRAGAAAALTLVGALLLGGRIIRWLQTHFREPIVSASDRLNQLHRHKQATPTMGGLFVAAGIALATLLWADASAGFVLPALVLLAGLTALGACDDLRKLRAGQRGLSPTAKLCGQLAVSLVVALLLYQQLSGIAPSLELAIPLTGANVPLGWGFIPLAVLVLVASSNAVNLTDGLDGLATGCLLVATLAMAAVAYVAGDGLLAARWNISHVPGAGEIVVLAGAMLGALLGFLRFNWSPARVFLGDTGSLPLGGLLGLIALVARQELLLLVVGGVFVAEALSVILQVGVYKWKRRRVFLCAPLHHHFQFLGWNERRVVARFWLAGVGCALLGLWMFTQQAGSLSFAKTGW